MASRSLHQVKRSHTTGRGGGPNKSNPKKQLELETRGIDPELANEYTSSKPGKKEAIGGQHAIQAIIDKAAKKRGGIAKIWEKIIQAALDGSYKHQELTVHYYYGKPTEKIHIDKSSTPVVQNKTIVKVVADEDKLRKLIQDKLDAADKKGEQKKDDQAINPVDQETSK